MSLREALLKALSNGPLARKEIVAAVEAVGYVFTTKNPLNSIGSILYSNSGPIKSKDGKFYLAGGPTVGTSKSSGDTQLGVKTKRKVSAASRAKMAAAQKGRWAKTNAGK